MTFAPPVVATRGSQDPSAPLVVLLHGRGADERSMLDLVEQLPDGTAYAAVRAPIAEGDGYAWFANRGLGRPVAESLSDTSAWFGDWLDEVAPVGRPVILVGFSGGAAFAAGLIFDDPDRYAGAAILYGTAPFDSGVPVTAGRLSGVPTFVAQGDADHVLPRDLLDRTWTYLLAESGSPVVATRDPGGHQLPAATVRELHRWLSHRTHFLRERPSTTPATALAWVGLAEAELPERAGPRPDASRTIPQQGRRMILRSTPLRYPNALSFGGDSGLAVTVCGDVSAAWQGRRHG